METINISEYKKSIMEMFNSLTDIEIQAVEATAALLPQHDAYATIYISAMDRCRKLLEIILKDEQK